MTKSQNDSQSAQTASVVSRETTPANGFIAAGVDEYPSRFDEDVMHDVFIVVAEVANGEHVSRTVYAASADDARQAYHENYADEAIVEVHQ